MFLSIGKKFVEYVYDNQPSTMIGKCINYFINGEQVGKYILGESSYKILSIVTTVIVNKSQIATVGYLCYSAYNIAGTAGLIPASILCLL